MALTSIPLDPKVRDRLKTYRTGGMSYSDVITRLMDERERDAFLRELQKEADAVEDWVDAEDL